MKNKELIKILLDYNLEADVTLTTSEDIEISYISGHTNGKKFDKNNTPILFIEGKDICEE